MRRYTSLLHTLVGFTLCHSTRFFLFFWSETSLGWFGGQWNGNITLAVTPYMRRFVRTFKIFSLLLFIKKQKQNESIYCMNEYEKFFLKSPYIFSKTTPAYIFINYINLWKFVIIVFNAYLKFHQIIKYFYNFLKNKHKIWISSFVKFAQIIFIIYPSFLKMFSKIFKISPNFFRIFL